MKNELDPTNNAIRLEIEAETGQCSEELAGWLYYVLPRYLDIKRRQADGYTCAATKRDDIGWSSLWCEKIETLANKAGLAVEWNPDSINIHGDKGEWAGNEKTHEKWAKIFMRSMESRSSDTEGKPKTSGDTGSESK